jgi:hypothetical protein
MDDFKKGRTGKFENVAKMENPERTSKDMVSGCLACQVLSYKEHFSPSKNASPCYTG